MFIVIKKCFHFTSIFAINDLFRRIFVYLNIYTYINFISYIYIYNLYTYIYTHKFIKLSL
jgi:hypothetical protein